MFICWLPIEFVLFLCSGLKPGQRKVMFTCFKRNLVKEMKVAQLAGSVAELSAYHHGEVSKEASAVQMIHKHAESLYFGVLITMCSFSRCL